MLCLIAIIIIITIIIIERSDMRKVRSQESHKIGTEWRKCHQGNSPIRYGAGIIDWTKNEIDEIDRKTQKMFNMYGDLHLKLNVDRLYLKRKTGGRGHISVGDYILNERNILGLHTG